MIKIVAQEEIAAAIETLLAAQAFKLDSPEETTVRSIIAGVAKRGDAALREYTKQFDRQELGALRLSKEAIEEAVQMTDSDFNRAIAKAIENITAFHRKQKPDEWFETLLLDVVLGQRLIPLARAGVYVPGGRAAYPSSVLMGVIPALVAGVKEVALVSPPPISPYVLAAAAKVGVTEIYQVGGAQAIAALALGTETIKRVDKIVGPGNIYVTLAKKQLFGLVDIDSLAGPSNVVIIADEDAEPEFIAADLLAQVEHDPKSFAVLFTDSEKIVEGTRRELEKQKTQLARQAIIEQATIMLFQLEGIRAAIELTNKIAPEHLELMIASPQRHLEKLRNAGAIFLGPHSPVPVGDYIAGPNHVLPTGGTARFASPLGVYDFVKTQSIIGYTKPALKNVWKDIKLLAEIEGLDAHARSVEVRFS
ncbi:histidinol dehydrogenase [Candidatus Saganbacteria bacterium CG08_land_8_20_14_0_20_45_16]|uniref:Histidinol dehydrogenase n=1 Tax=Candidatus Saganbacteria bacterium CG08_land_8_20_14_0_20_45_16 TaxID=2014293 RepID=A0A2H0Y1R4_UNCSA|nr:MAG: histidinol dehydrogenase [Candidatus Saganbacteria bacterium CG08_land_8_20_14_0_20_45_16]